MRKRSLFTLIAAMLSISLLTTGCLSKIFGPSGDPDEFTDKEQENESVLPVDDLEAETTIVKNSASSTH